MNTITYDDRTVRKFVIATLVWGAVAFLLGVVIALQLSDWRLNFDLPWFTFGRLRPLHTNAAIFAFGGNAIFAGIYYSSQRLLRARPLSQALSSIHFWGWQLIIVLAALTLPLGYTSGKEYAELEWPIDLLITVIWVAFAVNFFGMVFKRRERHLYVAIWFYIATIVAVAILHIVNSLALPVDLFKSYPIYAGVQDALVQWWYGHNAVAFFLTTPFVGLMYYFVPKASSRPIYSYRLSIVHFWGLVFIYIWAGPHHLLYTALPEWAQTLGMVFSVMLWAPSWGALINGLLTVRGVWDRVRTEVVLKFLVAAITFYGMATFEGPLLSIKSVNKLAHYTDWIVGHVHSGTLGWNGMLTFGIFYWMIPRLWKTKLHSESLANAHFWLATAGTILYMVSLWAAGITQGLMLSAIDGGGRLMYPDFIETVARIIPLYWVRALSGVLFFSGYILMLYNVRKTISHAPPLTDESVASAPLLIPLTHEERAKMSRHRLIESLPTLFLVLTIVGVLVGTAFELVPAFTTREYVALDSSIRPYTPLEIAGRDIYVREGCYVCHSQMIRPIAHEQLRYGAPSTIGESQYDHPFQWGSKRTGPDLARVGGKYSSLWHFRHLINPRDLSPQSIMPNYPWLAHDMIAFDRLGSHMLALQKVGVPISNQEITEAESSARAQAKQIAQELASGGAPAGLEDREITALTAYLQSLGKLTEPAR